MGEVVQELTPSWHAAHRGSAAAIVMASSGAATTYAELEQRSRDSGWRAAGSRPSPRGTHRVVDGEQPLRFSRCCGRLSAPGSTTRRSTGTCVRTRCSTCSTTAERPHSSRRRRWVTCWRRSISRASTRRSVSTATCRDSNDTTTSCRPRRLTWRSTNRKVARCSTRPARPGDPRACRRICRTRRSAIRRRHRYRSPRESG